MCIWNFLRWMQYPGAIRTKEARQADVFPRVPSRRHLAACVVGDSVSARPLRAAPVLQLLGGLARADDRAFLDTGQLSRTLARECLPANSFPLDVDCGSRHDFFPVVGLSACLLSFVLCGREKRSVLSVSDYSAMGQLPGTRLCLEDDFRQRRRAQYFVAVRSPDKTSAGVLAL